MSSNLVSVAYIGASALFILSLGGLSNQESARRGNIYGIIGMLIAVAATALGISATGYGTLGAVVLPGAIIGAIVASRVAMTSKPARGYCKLSRARSITGWSRGNNPPD